MQVKSFVLILPKQENQESNKIFFEPDKYLQFSARLGALRRQGINVMPKVVLDGTTTKSGKDEWVTYSTYKSQKKEGKIW